MIVETKGWGADKAHRTRKRNKLPAHTAPAVERVKLSNKSPLRAFMQNECANRCEHCLVLDGYPCEYFERVVLGPPDYKYRTPGYEWEKLFAEYARINPAVAAGGVAGRRCECGEPLQPRRRMCDRCRAKKRQAAYRRARGKRKAA